MSSPRPNAFLVFSGYNLRGVIAFCRALKRDGRIFRIIACTDSDPIFRTVWRHAVIATRAHQSLDLPDIEGCIRLAGKTPGISAWYIAPSSEFLIRWSLDRRDQLAALGCHLPLPSRSIYSTVSDKRPFTEFCRARGLAVPAEGQSPDAVGLPCIAKPVTNVTEDQRSLYPWLLRTAADLADFRARAQSPDYFFQEWVQGESIYLLLHVSRTGDAICFSQRNLAQQPGGKSIVLAETAEFHRSPAAGKWVEALRATGFFGLVMIELKIRPDGEGVLIEANPRIWGPLQLVADHCPALLEAYFDEMLGARTHSPAAETPPRAGSYLWYGGARQTWRQGKALDWHVPPPRSPRRRLLQALRSDVYFRRDTWRCFWRE